jgi:hypothetical protein
MTDYKHKKSMPLQEGNTKGNQKPSSTTTSVTTQAPAPPKPPTPPSHS